MPLQSPGFPGDLGGSPGLAKPLFYGLQTEAAAAAQLALRPAPAQRDPRETSRTAGLPAAEREPAWRRKMEEDTGVEDALENATLDETLDEQPAAKHADLEAVVARAEAAKKEGNDLFQRGKTFAGHTLGKTSMMDACAKYADAYTILEDALGSAREEDRAALAELRITVLLNLAAAGLALESPEEAKNCCNSVLEAHPNHPKALYRRAKAHLLETEPAYDEALRDLENAVRAAPKSRDLREEYKRVKSERDKAEQKKAFRRGTEEGRRRLEAKARRDKHDRFVAWAKAQDHDKNGAVLDDYVWGQTVDELTVVIPVDVALASDVKCEITRKHVRVEASGETVLDKNLCHPVRVDESYWDHETAQGCICVVLTKENASRKETPGYEWWASAFEGDAEIDTKTCNVGESLAQLPEKQKQELAQSIEKKQADEKARAKAMKDPKKRAMFDLLKEKFPDVPIDLR